MNEISSKKKINVFSACVKYDKMIFFNYGEDEEFGFNLTNCSSLLI